MGFRGWSHHFPNNSKMADGGHIEFRKTLISPYRMKIFAHSFVQGCNLVRLLTTAVRRDDVQPTMYMSSRA